MCRAMKWNHLPVAGGLYDQHPRLLEEWETLFALEAKYEQEKQREREQEQRARQMRGR